jgi:hypothetical protein
MLTMRRDLQNADGICNYCIVRPEPVGCEYDAPTSFGVAHSRGVFGPPDAGLCYMKLLR